MYMYVIFWDWGLCSCAYVHAVLCTLIVAADVFRLNEQPEHAKKKLDVCASYFEIYLGKVCTVI